MGFIKLEPRCPQRSAIVASVDPEPNWTMNDLLTELNTLEEKLGYHSPSPLKQPPPGYQEILKVEELVSRGHKPFVMSISDDDTSGDDDAESYGESEDEVSEAKSLVAGARFSCNDLDFSDSEASEEELDINSTQSFLMHKNSLEEGTLFELEREHQQKVKEQVRSTLSALELDYEKNCYRSQHAVLQIEKYIEERRETDRSLDKQYRCKIAEVLDSHLSAIQRDHQKRSLIEEQRIKDDAAIEEAKRKEKAIYEEEVRREKAKAEAEAREKAAKLAEERRLALETAKKEAQEAARKEAERAAAEAAEKAAQNKVGSSAQNARERKEGSSSSDESGIKVMAADAALKSEANRLRIYNDVAKEIPSIPQKEFEKYGRKMFRIVSQITGTVEAVRSKAQDFISTINGSVLPHPISILVFAQKIVSFCETPRGNDDRFAFACACVILLVSSEVPVAMDFVLAELHKACIYTVPKHLHPSKPDAQSKDYWKMIGYREEDSKLESSQSYLKRLQPYMKLYAALVQTDMQGIRNPHGLEHGWAWLAMFLNTLPANRSTAFALDAFLRMTGFALYRRYKSQFIKILDVISRSYLPALKKRDDQKLGEIVNRLEGYLDDKAYLKEPEGWRLQEGYLLSEEFV
ncbi:protein GLE1 isoform X2 [Asparagus officinalis]|uniref:protein GLE1 isoform X1 n=1 Tax=Asparagus officinalis TaxID=4686 RepID=UPI00098E40F8|nr:protein GLE1 isoform X1 [Asparagus officinalis]XP_020251909.1 protein GLE1 isoform X2 [Asparagus officinalis]